MQANDLEMARHTMCEIVDQCRDGGFEAALEEQQWIDFLEADEQLAVASLFEAQGLNLASESGLPVLVSQRLGIASIESSILFPFGADVTVSSIGTLKSDSVYVDGVLFGDLRECLILPIDDANGGVALIEVDADVALPLRSSTGNWEDALPLSRIQGLLSSSQYTKLDLDWRVAETSARRALGYELIATANAMLDLTVAHVRERQQFGRPLGAFQAIRNALADVHVGIESGRNLLDIAFLSGDSFSASVAKAQAGRAALLAARHCLQFCGAIGWTWEFGLHQYIRRAKFLDSILGSSDTLTRQVGASLAAAGQAAPLTYEMRSNL